MTILRHGISALGASMCIALLPAAGQPVMAQHCQLDNEALQAMHKARVQFTFSNGRELQFQAKLADDPVTRAAGFQRVCAETIAAEPILFLFENELLPSFHMNNVVAPIDIAFIDREGRIDSIHAMQTYILGSKRRPVYSPQRPVIAALEVQPGFYQQHAIDQSVRVSWQTSLD